MKKYFFLAFSLTLIFLMNTTLEEAQAKPKKTKYVGYKKCGGCHVDERDSWLETSHAKTFDLLKPKAREKAKKKADLDPAKDYTEDDNCLPCHTTGFGETGGYKKNLDKKKAKFLQDITCEMCHGRGSLYRLMHRKAGKLFDNEGKTIPRKVLVKTGQNFDYEEACAACHLNYEGSPWEKAKKPYTPFTPDVDKKYIFNFEKMVNNVPEDLHEHYKLKGVFKGPPVPKIREEFQKTAKEARAPEEE